MGELKPEINPGIESEVEQPSPHQETLHRIYQTMQEHNAHAVKTFFPGKDFELIWDGESQMGEEELEKAVLDRIAGSHSGYLVVEGANPDQKTVLFKMKLEDYPDDDRMTGRNERLFYEDIAPEIMGNLPPELSSIRIPKLYSSGQTTEGSYVVTEFAEGKQVGTIYEAAEPLTIEEFDKLIRFVRFFQDSLDPKKVQELSANFDLSICSKGQVGSLTKYRESLENQERPGFRQLLDRKLGKDYVTEMVRILREGEELLLDTPPVLTNYDLNPSNLIRSGKGADITIIDWERLKLIPNPVAAYGFLIDPHWRNPKLQHEMIRQVIELNQDIPNFKKLLRADMIFPKFSYEFFWRDRSNFTEEKRKLFEEGEKPTIKFVQDVVDKKGPWAD